jgi:hypothetical protein
MSGRWLEEHGSAIGSGVQVVVEHGRVTLIRDVATGCDVTNPALFGLGSRRERLPGRASGCRRRQRLCSHENTDAADAQRARRGRTTAPSLRPRNIPASPARIVI